MRRTPLASIIGGLSKKVGRIATLGNTIGGDFIGRTIPVRNSVLLLPIVLSFLLANSSVSGAYKPVGKRKAEGERSRE